jgi:hypothetical protein
MFAENEHALFDFYATDQASVYMIVIESRKMFIPGKTDP